MRFIFSNTIAFFISLQMKIICIYFMRAENRKIRLRKRIRKLWKTERRNLGDYWEKRLFEGGFVMPFVRDSVNYMINEKREEDPEFRKAWDDSREEYRLIGEMIALRKAEKITQVDLAKMIDSRQQVISRIEKMENSPSLKLFCNLLGALGYELRIVKR
jgi:DNA-binding XRE family transcriptional regulator